MNYLSYIQTAFTGYTVTEETNYNYSGSGTVFVIKYLGGGQNYNDSVIQPVQISAYTDDINTARELLSAFAKTYSGTSFWENNEFIKQTYSTPLTLTQFQPLGTNHNGTLIVNGSLIISTNLSDITKVEIDNFSYFTTGRKISCVTVEDTQPDANRIGETNIKQAIVQFVCSMENKNNDVCNKISRLRQGTYDIDNSFTIKLTFSDNNRTETYTMKHHSSVIDSSNALSPVTVITFVR